MSAPSSHSRFPEGGLPAFQAFFNRHYGAVYRRIYALTRRREEAEELSNDLFMSLWQRREHLQQPESWEAYLMRAAAYKAIDSLRKRRHLHLPPEEAMELPASSSPEEDLIAADFGKRLLEALEYLPPQCREAFELSRLGGLSYAEIADTLQISPKTVENQIGKALSRLRRLLLSAPALWLALCS